ncbi:hypothetical protein DL96DRAFT_1677302 [Flagelloscypha sp. PMI_526]|nr:hypothetical protein DL96DRAFT_1677302 [Flagelloscypha sp. PMI_526]
MSTNKLKRKLGDLGVDVSSTRANENFVLIGTPLPALEKSKDLNEFVPLWKQEVRDEQGRRRLHGAFTGGFSAGYFNTVGSKEGWTPSTFVSSRNDRSKKKQARPEDFMDEEDLQDMKDSLKLVDKADEMDVSQSRQVVQDDEDPLIQKLQMSMMPTASDSTGQGIGPRISLRKRRLQDMQASTTQMLSIEDVTLTEEDAEADKHKYPPRDTPLLKVDRKDNHHGVGYRPGMGLNESLGHRHGPAKGPNIAAGFGLGASNEADEDDLDVYDSAIGPGGSRVAYDIAQRDDDTNRFASTSSSKPLSTSFQTFPDGRPVLEGFILSETPAREERWYPLPKVPAGWTPNPRRITHPEDFAGKENQPASSASHPLPHSQWKAGITADQRGALLGETPLPAAPRSVFDFISQKDRDRLQNISATIEQRKIDGIQPTISQPTSEINIPFLEPHIASSALNGFQPFTSDPPKQARYKAYLQSQANPSKNKLPAPLDAQSVDSFNKELADYAKAAQIFKPVSGAMAGRFQTAKVVEKGPDVKGGLHNPSQDGEYASSVQQGDFIEEKEVDLRANAARLGMWGPMTRETIPWMPERLLCKRFGVKEPEVATPEPDLKAQAAEEVQREEELAQAEKDVKLLDGPVGPRDLANVGLGEDEWQGRDTLTYQRPSMDVFKAIFASDEEDSEDEEEDKKDGDGDIAMDSVDLDVPPPPPSLPTQPLASSDPVDPSTFKPTFIPRDGRSTKDKDKSSSKKKKKDKKTALVSFDVEEDGDEGGLSISPERPKKKRKKKEKSGNESQPPVLRPPPQEEEEEWVEKPSPFVVQQQSEGNGKASRRGRAADFM